jgi:hypothetical protein
MVLRVLLWRHLLRAAGATEQPGQSERTGDNGEANGVAGRGAG